MGLAFRIQKHDILYTKVTLATLQTSYNNCKATLGKWQSQGALVFFINAPFQSHWIEVELKKINLHG